MTRRTVVLMAAVASFAGLAGCRGGAHQAAVAIDSAQLARFAPLPATMESPDNPVTDDKVALGRALYADRRLSQGGDVSCNSCHNLATGGADTGRVSIGFRGQRGGRNSPTVFNAAGHTAQFWDGRARDVEAQALGPILNPVEMAMPSGEAVMRVVRPDTAYQRMFAAAFPADRRPMTFDNLGRAIGAFERRLVTPSRWDRFLHGVDTALTVQEKQGFNTFVAVGCPGCHNGIYVGGGSFQRAGLVQPWPDTSDLGRYGLTHSANDRMVFKVPSLRNVTRTGPYFHNGAVASLDSAVVMMAHYQLGRDVTPEQMRQIVTFLHALEGEAPAEVIAPPRRGD